MKRLLLINLVLILCIVIVPTMPKQMIMTLRETFIIEPAQKEQQISSRSGTRTTEELQCTEEGKNLIKKWEDCYLTAYRLEGEQYYTIRLGTLCRGCQKRTNYNTRRSR